VKARIGIGVACIAALCFAAAAAGAQERAGEAEVRAGTAGAAEPAGPAEEKIQSAKGMVEYGLLAISIGIIVVGGAIGTAMAQSSIGTAVAAACAEDRKFLGAGLLLLALPETILILVLGMAFMMLQKIP